MSLTRKKTIRVGAIGALLCFSVLVGCSGSEAKQSAEDAAGSEPVRVQVARVEKQTVERTLEIPATVEGVFEADVYARVGGYVAEVLVDAGDQVAEGQVLVRLSVPELEDDVRRKLADVEVAQTELEEAQVLAEEAAAAVEVATAAVREKEAAVEAARAMVALRESELKRWEELTQGDAAIEKRKVDEARYALEAARAELKAAEAAVATAQAALKAAEAARASKQAATRSAEKRVAAAQAALDQARTMASYAEIKAPWPAVVVGRFVHPGDFAFPAATNSSARPLVRLARIDEVRVVGYVPASEASYVDVGDPVELYGFASAPGLHRRATVTRVARTLDPDTRLMRCEVHLEKAAKGQGRELIPGAFGYMRITLDTYPEATVVPSSSLLTDDLGQTYVLVVGATGQLEKREVSVLYDTGQKAVVRGEVTAGDRVVQAGRGSLQPGQRVIPVGAGEDR